MVSKDCRHFEVSYYRRTKLISVSSKRSFIGRRIRVIMPLILSYSVAQNYRTQKVLPSQSLQYRSEFTELQSLEVPSI